MNSIYTSGQRRTFRIFPLLGSEFGSWAWQVGLEGVGWGGRVKKKKKGIPQTDNRMFAMLNDNIELEYDTLVECCQ